MGQSRFFPPVCAFCFFSTGQFFPPKQNNNNKNETNIESSPLKKERLLFCAPPTPTLSHNETQIKKPFPSAIHILYFLPPYSSLLFFFFL